MAFALRLPLMIRPSESGMRERERGSAPLLKGTPIGSPLLLFSPDGRRLASASWDETVRIWDVETGASVGVPLVGHTSGVASITFSPDGVYLASGSYDKTVRIWDAKTGVCIGAPLEDHAKFVTSVTFSPDGLHLASGSGDRTVRIWDIKRTGLLMKQRARAIPYLASVPNRQASSDQHAVPNFNPQNQQHLQYPEHLFPPVFPKFQLKDGWILGPNGELIVWVPAAHRGSLKDPGYIDCGIMSRTELDFSHLKCGEEWVQCR